MGCQKSGHFSVMKYFGFIILTRSVIFILNFLSRACFQAARMANYTRYSPADWASSNVSHYNSADNARNNSERIRNEAVRLARDRDEKTVLTQRDADRRIGER